MVGGLAAPAGRLEEDREVLLQFGLADELGEPPGPQAGFGRQLLLDRLGREQLLTHQRRPEPSRLSAAFKSSALSPSSGRSINASRTSSGP